MEKLLSKLRVDYPSISFVEGDRFTWSPKNKEVIYRTGSHQSLPEVGVLHELAHAVLGHHTFFTDYELLQMEVEAWDEAKQLGKKYKVIISEDHIQDCLDTYRDWLYMRSTCPSCTASSLQNSRRQYTCSNCKESWSVSNSRFCRPYRKGTKKALSKK